MIEINTKKDDAILYNALLSELRPDWNVLIVDGDVNLYKLGLIDYYPCVVQIEACEKDMVALDDEIDQMESDAYSYGDSLCLKENCESTMMECRSLEQAEKRMMRFEKFAPLYGFWH